MYVRYGALYGPPRAFCEGVLTGGALVNGVFAARCSCGVEKGGYGGYVACDRPPRWSVPYVKYAEGGVLSTYTPGWLQQTRWAVGLAQR